MNREEAIKIVKSHYPANKQMLNEALEFLIPELKESEDEKIRKDLITFLDEIWHLGKNANFDKWDKSDCSNWIAWLEKQGEQKSQGKSALEAIKEEKVDNANKVEPKFKIGDKIIEKNFDECGCGTVIDIKDGKYYFDNGNFIWIKEQGLWKLVEQNPTDKIETKFKVGDWIISHYNHVAYIKSIDEKNYSLSCNDCRSLSFL